uniref:AlNc14C249G9611 protein n=1 Tax=Albugo laibachii Nc14 TaxID=890382 RepID=F0WTD1_9STRA|nr:AlNc14C249G9611 [Albugo laibachii Nc14]|eukprot:CCA24621.1 AlNc14C249G9611 [Albugo laibachii Nc14]
MRNRGLKTQLVEAEVAASHHFVLSKSGDHRWRESPELNTPRTTHCLSSISAILCSSFMLLSNQIETCHSLVSSAIPTPNIFVVLYSVSVAYEKGTPFGVIRTFWHFPISSTNEQRGLATIASTFASNLFASISFQHTRPTIWH